MADYDPIELATQIQNFEQLNPFLIFEFVDKHVERISFRQVPAESLAAALKPYINVEKNLSLDQFVDNAKYIRAAYLLGVRKYQPRFKDDTLALAIYESDNIPSNEKQQLFEWLLQENYFTTNPLPLKTIYKALEDGKDLSFGCILKHFPIDESQIVGYYPTDSNPSDLQKRYNILHLAVYEQGIWQMWESLLKIFSTEEIIQLLLEPNKMNRSALYLITSNYFNNKNRMPKEILLAFIKMAQLYDFEPIKEFYKIPSFVGSSVFNLLYIHGMTPDKVPPMLTDNNKLQENPFTRFKDKEKKSLDGRPTESAEKNFNSSDAFPIDKLLPELVWIIAEYLDIEGLVGLFTMSKKMALLTDNRFWRQIYEQNVYPNKKLHNYRTMAQQYVNSAPNWLNRNFNKIKLDSGLRASSLMDENWLVLLGKDSIYMWDCHTHKVHWICSTVQDGQVRIEPMPVLILGGIYNGICPPILLQESVEGQNSRDYIAVGGEYIELPINALPQACQIDENLLLLYNPDRKLFDIQSRTIIETTDCDPGQSDTWHLIYNPFNHTHIALCDIDLVQCHFEVCDMNHQLIRKFSTSIPKLTSYNFAVIGEFKLLWHDFRDYIVIDFSGTEVVETKFTLRHSTGSKLMLPCSLNRAILADDRTGLVTICHFPSMQWEAVYHLQATITAANSRYLVGNEDGSAVIYDFCK